MNPDYKNNVLKYLEDKEFIDWVQSGFVTHNEKWSDLKNDPTQKGNIHEAIDMIEMLNFEVDVPSQKTKTDLLNRINASIDTTSEVNIPVKKKSSITRKLYWTIGIAASFLLLITMFWPRNINEFQTDLAEFKTIQLPDNSEINLNAESQLTYVVENFDEERKIQLQGEAFFNVKKGVPFSVQTNIGKVTVLGTSFNVVSRENFFVVACETGKVRVELNGSNESVILSPNEKCFLNSNKLSKTNSFHKSNEWLKGVFHFKGEKLSRVIEEMERQFDIVIDNGNIDIDTQYTGFFDRKDMEKSLQSVFWTLGIKYEISAENIVVLSK